MMTAKLDDLQREVGDTRIKSSMRTDEQESLEKEFRKL